MKFTRSLARKTGLPALYSSSRTESGSCNEREHKESLRDTNFNTLFSDDIEGSQTTSPAEPKSTRTVPLFVRGKAPAELLTSKFLQQEEWVGQYGIVTKSLKDDSKSGDKLDPDPTANYKCAN